MYLRVAMSIISHHISFDQDWYCTMFMRAQVFSSISIAKTWRYSPFWKCRLATAYRVWSRMSSWSDECCKTRLSLISATVDMPFMNRIVSNLEIAELTKAKPAIRHNWASIIQIAHCVSSDAPGISGGRSRHPTASNRFLNSTERGSPYHSIRPSETSIINSHLVDSYPYIKEQIKWRGSNLH